MNGSKDTVCWKMYNFFGPPCILSAEWSDLGRGPSDADTLCDGRARPVNSLVDQLVLPWTEHKDAFTSWRRPATSRHISTQQINDKRDLLVSAANLSWVSTVICDTLWLFSTYCPLSFAATGWSQKKHPDHQNRLTRCWHSYSPGVRCKYFAYTMLLTSQNSIICCLNKI